MSINKRGLFGILGLLCLIAGIYGFLSTLQLSNSKTFIEWLGDMWVVGWILISFVALLAMMIDFKDRIIAVTATFMWLILFFVAVFTSFVMPQTAIILSSSQMLFGALLIFVMPAFIAEDAKHGWD